MLVNFVDISTYKAKLLSKDIQTCDVTIYSDWLAQSLSPSYYGKKEKYKKIKLEFAIVDIDDISCLNDIGNLVLQFEKSTIKFDDLPTFYDCALIDKTHSKATVNGIYLANDSSKSVYSLSVDLQAPYGYTPAISTTLSSLSQVLSVQGNLSTEAIITISPTINTSSIKLSGFGEDITINNLIKDVPVVIDGIAKTILQNGTNKFPETDMWGFPTLNPGNNQIIIDHSGATISVLYYPRFM